MSLLQTNSSVTDFFLIGFQNLHSFKIPLFLLIIITYIMAVSGNLLIVVLVSTSNLLKAPMYFFLSHLSLCDFLLCSSIIPKTLNGILHGGSSISFLDCFIQFYIFGLCLITECYLLTVMSYDRYVAICNPLSYILIMNFNFCLYLVSGSWLAALLISFISSYIVFSVVFCGPNAINHFYCDLSPLLELACSDTFSAKLEASLLTAALVLLPFIFIMVTYVYIFTTILGIASNTGKQKAFSTCSSHLTVVCAFFGTLISIYLSPSKGSSITVNKILSLIYTLVTPLFNPVVYTLRNQEIRKTLKVFFNRLARFNKNPSY